MAMIKAAAGVDCWGHGGSFILKESKFWALGENKKLQKENLKYGPRFINSRVSSAD